MLIIDQDREYIYSYDGQPLISAPVFGPEGSILGFNLYIEGNPKSLGTFDSLKEITAEMTAITISTGAKWFVSGYSDYDGWDAWKDLCQIMKED